MVQHLEQSTLRAPNSKVYSAPGNAGVSRTFFSTSDGIGANGKEVFTKSPS